MVGDVPAQVRGTVLAGAHHFHRAAGNFAAQDGSFAEGQAVLDAASHVPVPPGISIEVGDLVQHEVAKIVDVEEVANLLAGAAEADVLQPAIETVGGNPERHDSLVCFRHLPRARKQAATIDDEPDPVSVAIFGHHEFGRQFRHAVQGARPVEWKLLADAVFGGAGNGLRGPQTVARLGLLEGQAIDRRHRVDAAGGHEQEVGLGLPGNLQAMEAAGQVGVDQVFRRTAVAGQNRGLRGALQNQVRRGTNRRKIRQ